MLLIHVLTDHVHVQGVTRCYKKMSALCLVFLDLQPVLHCYMLCCFVHSERVARAPIALSSIVATSIVGSSSLPPVIPPIATTVITSPLPPPPPIVLPTTAATSIVPT